MSNHPGNRRWRAASSAELLQCLNPGSSCRIESGLLTSGMTLMMAQARVHIPYGKWRRYASGAQELEQCIDQQNQVFLKAPKEARVHELGRVVDLTGPEECLVLVLRSLLHKVAAPDLVPELYDPDEPAWFLPLNDDRMGPFTGMQLALYVADPAGSASQIKLPGDVHVETFFTHGKLKAAIPLWLLVSHYTLPGTDRATMPGETAEECASASAQVAAAVQQRMAAKSGGGAPPVAASRDAHVVDDDVDMTAADLEATSHITMQIHELRAGPEYEALVTAMELDDEVDVGAQHFTDLMDFVMDYMTASTADGVSAAAEGGSAGTAAAAKSMVHLHFVLDTSFLCHPKSQDALKVLQQRFAPSARAGAGAAGGGGSGGGGGQEEGPGVIVSAVVPRQVYAELDSLKDAQGRGDVSKYARAAFSMLLEGIRERDAFLALQSRDEARAAAAAAGEEHPSADMSVVLCARHMLHLFTTKQEAQDVTQAEAGPGLTRRVMVLSNDNGLCVLAEAESITSIRQLDMPAPTNTSAMTNFLHNLATTGQLVKNAAKPTTTTTTTVKPVAATGQLLAGRTSIRSQASRDSRAGDQDMMECDWADAAGHVMGSTTTAARGLTPGYDVKQAMSGGVARPGDVGGVGGVGGMKGGYQGGGGIKGDTRPAGGFLQHSGSGGARRPMNALPNYDDIDDEYGYGDNNNNNNYNRNRQQPGGVQQQQQYVQAQRVGSGALEPALASVHLMSALGAQPVEHNQWQGLPGQQSAVSGSLPRQTSGQPGVSVTAQPVSINMLQQHGAQSMMQHQAIAAALAQQQQVLAQQHQQQKQQQALDMLQRQSSLQQAAAAAGGGGAGVGVPQLQAMQQQQQGTAVRPATGTDQHAMAPAGFPQQNVVMVQGGQYRMASEPTATAAAAAKPAGGVQLPGQSMLMHVIQPGAFAQLPQQQQQQLTQLAAQLQQSQQGTAMALQQAGGQAPSAAFTALRADANGMAAAAQAGGVSRSLPGQHAALQQHMAAMQLGSVAGATTAAAKPQPSAQGVISLDQMLLQRQQQAATQQLLAMTQGAPVEAKAAAQRHLAGLPSTGLSATAAAAAAAPQGMPQPLMEQFQMLQQAHKVQQQQQQLDAKLMQPLEVLKQANLLNDAWLQHAGASMARAVSVPTGAATTSAAAAAVRQDQISRSAKDPSGGLSLDDFGDDYGYPNQPSHGTHQGQVHARSVGAPFHTSAAGPSSASAGGSHHHAAAAAASGGGGGGGGGVRQAQRAVSGGGRVGDTAWLHELHAKATGGDHVVHRNKGPGGA